MVCLIIHGLFFNLASLALYSLICFRLCWVLLAAYGLLAAVVPLVANHRLYVCGLSSCGTVAWLQ